MKKGKGDIFDLNCNLKIISAESEAHVSSSMNLEDKNSKDARSRDLEEISSNERTKFGNMGIYILEPHENAKNLKRRKTKKSVSQDKDHSNTQNGLNPQEIELKINPDEN
jgi:hypothetical protein